jgi:lipopolysaccharide transport system permease protein
MSTVAVPARTDQRRFRIEAKQRSLARELREIWEYRELMGFLVWRDIKVRYVQTILGPTWALLVPFSTMIVFTLIFGRVARFQGEYKVPYPLFLFVGQLPWLYFANCLTSSSRSVVANINLVTKVYVPRLMIPIAAIVVPIVDFLFASVILFGLFAWYGTWPHWHTVVSPFFLALALLCAFGVGLWLSALNVRYRDIPFVIPFLTQIWFFVTPVLYGPTYIPERFQWLLKLNPMTGAIDGFRWAVLGRGVPHYGLFGYSLAIGLALTVSGLLYYRRVERQFADVI